jgi:hypothetical protein
MIRSFNDEAQFTLNGVNNAKNPNLWDHDNSHVTEKM